MKIKVDKYILSEHPKKEDVLVGGRVDGYIVKKLVKRIKKYPTGIVVSYKLNLYNPKKELKRVVSYTPSQKKIGDFDKSFYTAKKGTYYTTWD